MSIYMEFYVSIGDVYTDIGSFISLEIWNYLIKVTLKSSSIRFKSPAAMALVTRFILCSNGLL
jgi:hypothetical protein